MNRKRLSAALAVAALIALVPTTLAGNPFSRSTTTAGGNETWDSDQIDTENVTETGDGVYVAVLDTGLVANWKDYFPDARVAQELGTGFYQNIDITVAKNECELTLNAKGAVRQVSFIGSRISSHGTHTRARSSATTTTRTPMPRRASQLPPIQVRGIAPNATLIPVKVLADFQIPARPKCTEIPAAERAEQTLAFGTDGMVAAGIDYITSLATGRLAGSRIVINMSLGDTVKADVIEDAIDRAIAAGVIVVASAGNEGEDGMGWPGAYPQVISAGASGWTASGSTTAPPATSRPTASATACSGCRTPTAA